MRNLLAVAAVAGLSVSTASAAELLINDFENGTRNSTGPQNGGLIYFGTGPNGIGEAQFDQTVSTATASTAVNGSTAVQLVPGSGQTFDPLVDFNTQQLLDLGLDTSNAVITFDYVLSGEEAGSGYNNILVLANTDNSDNNSYNGGQKKSISGTTSGTLSLDFTSLISFLDPSVNPGYSSVRLIADRASTATGTITIDNVRITAIPEPLSMAAGCLGLVGMGLRRRR